MRIDLNFIAARDHVAILGATHVRITVDCRENFGDPVPLAKCIAAAPRMLKALQRAAAMIEVHAETCAAYARAGRDAKANEGLAAELRMHVDSFKRTIAAATGE